MSVCLLPNGRAAFSGGVNFQGESGQFPGAPRQGDQVFFYRFDAGSPYNAVCEGSCAMPSSRHSHGSAFLSNRLFVFGGLSFSPEKLSLTKQP